MDSDQANLASALVHLDSAFGFATNLIAFLTISLNKNLHTSFGILCACLATTNSCLLTLYSLWYLMPDSEMLSPGAQTTRIVGMMGCAFWMFGNRCHLLISINRLIAIVSPFKSRKYITKKVTIITVCFAAISAVLQNSPILLVEDVLFYYDRQAMMWSFASTEGSKFFEEYIKNLPVVTKLMSILIVDIVTLIHLRMYHEKKASNLSSANVSESRAVEVRLFKQSLSQSMPLLLGLISFAFITPMVTDQFTQFFTTTFMWHLTHGVDGLIIDIFHTRLELFGIKRRSENSIATITS